MLNNKKLLLSLALLLPFTLLKANDQEPKPEIQEMEDAGCGCGGGNVAPRPRPKPKPNPGQVQRPASIEDVSKEDDKKSILSYVISCIVDKDEAELDVIYKNLNDKMVEELPSFQKKLEEIRAKISTEETKAKVDPELEEILMNHGDLVERLFELLMKDEA